MTKKLYCVSSEKIPSREWLLGWFECYKCFSVLEYRLLNYNRRSRESLWKIYLKIKGAV